MNINLYMYVYAEIKSNEVNPTVIFLTRPISINISKASTFNSVVKTFLLS